MDNQILPVCSQCRKPYPEEGAPFQCSCGGVFDFPAFQLPGELKEMAIGQGLWKYKSLFSLGESLPVISLGEGNTPLCELEYHSQKIWAKLEFLNPTGSYKDRGSAVLTSFLASRGVTAAVEDSSGNAGASFAAYAARAGIRAEVYIPESASGPKRNQIEAYGAMVHRVPGPRSEASRAVLEAVKNGQIYASHAYMPFGLHGIATIAYEIFEQLGWKAPGTVITPVGHGGLLYGLMKGFEALKMASNAQEEPFYLGVQSQGCSPVFDAFNKGEFTLREPLLSDTIAEGVKVSAPVRGSAILRNLSGHRGKIISIGDDQLLQAYHDIAKKGFFIEPTSALVWAALEDHINALPAPVVMIFTGSGLKTQI
jgi:threonine synthase